MGMGRTEQHARDAARFFGRGADVVERGVSESTAQVERHDGEALIARFEHQHAREQGIERAFGRGGATFESPQLFMSGGSDVDLGDTGAQARRGGGDGGEDQ